MWSPLVTVETTDESSAYCVCMCVSRESGGGRRKEGREGGRNGGRGERRGREEEEKGDTVVKLNHWPF